MGINFSSGGTQNDATKVINFARFEYSNIAVSFTTTSSEYTFWSISYNRIKSTSSLYISSLIPASELPNGVWVGCFMSVNGYKHAKGFRNARPNTDTTIFGFDCMVTAGEIGSTTGNITISHGWNWGGANAAVKPFSYLNFRGGSGNPAADPRVSASLNTLGSMVILELDA